MASELREYDVDGWRCAALVEGPEDGPLVLAMHGFPDTAHTFHLLQPRLAAEGYRVVAPFMPGMPPSAPMPNGDYRIDVVARRLAGLVAAAGHDTAFLVGHDWGAVAAYGMAALRPARVARMVTAAVPPPSVFLRGLSPRQLMRSWYMAFFQLPSLPELVLRRGDLAFIESLWRRWSPGFEPDPVAFAALRERYADPGTAREALAWYRAIVPSLLGDADTRRRILAPVGRPTLVVGGERDGCIGVDVVRRSDRALGPDSSVATVPGGHFMHLEAPEAFADLVLAHLRG